MAPVRPCPEHSRSSCAVDCCGTASGHMKARPFLLLRVQRPTKEMVLAQGVPFAQEPDEKATVALTKCANH